MKVEREQLRHWEFAWLRSGVGDSMFGSGIASYLELLLVIDGFMLRAR